MNSMRNNGGLLVGVIGLAIVAFLLGDIMVSGSSFFGSTPSYVGKIDGKEISYNEFQAKVDNSTELYKNNAGLANIDEATTGYLIDQTWDQVIYQAIIDKKLKNSGVTVSPEELFDLVQGNSPHPEVRRAFTNPQTGTFDPAQVINFLRNMNNDESGETRRQWLAFEKAIKEERVRQKYYNLVKAGLNVTSVEAKKDFVDKNRTATVQLVVLDYTSVSDSSIKISESDFKSYYNANKYKYNQKENTRSFEYIFVDVIPSMEDSVAAYNWVNQQVTALHTSANDSVYINLNAETRFTGAYAKKGELSSAIDTVLFDKPAGTIYGPYFEAGSYKVAKVLKVRSLPDSVRARHILIKPDQGMEAAKQKADSLKNAIKQGANFASLAMQFSTDGSKDQGGDLGYFDDKTMVKPFSDACFFGRTGDVVVVESQFGIHVIEITDQKNFNKQVQIGVIDRMVAASSQTTQQLYAKINNVLSTVKSEKEFKDLVLEEGLNKRVAENVKANDRFIAGLESPREIIRWAFKADKGDISSLFEMPNKFVFALLTEVKDKGTIPFEYVKKEVEAEVRKEKKAELLKGKITKAAEGNADIASIAQKVGAVVQPASGINFAFPVIPGVSREPKLVGTIVSAEAGKLTKAVAGDRGVYIVFVESFAEPVALPDYAMSQVQMANTVKPRVDQELIEALKSKLKIEDNRLIFY